MNAVLANSKTLLDQFFADFDRAVQQNVRRTFAPTVDIAEVDGGYELRAELPGVRKEDVRIEVKDDALTLSGIKHAPEREGRGYRYNEAAYGEFRRSFNLPKTIDRERIEAKFADGILLVRLGHLPEIGPRSIEIA